MSLPHAASRRLAIGMDYLRTKWRVSIIFFFVIFAFFLGFAFVISPVVTNRVTYGGWHRWGDSGLVVFGVAFMALSVWSIFWPEGPGGVLTTATLSLIGLATSVPPIAAYWSIAGIIFYGLILGTLFTPIAQERFDTLFAPLVKRRRRG
jgi:hypothetical protein